MSIISCTSPYPSWRILPASIETSLPSAVFCARSSSPKRRSNSPRRGGGTLRQDRKASAAAPIFACTSAGESARSTAISTPSIGERQARSLPACAGRSTPNSCRSVFASMFAPPLPVQRGRPELAAFLVLDQHLLRRLGFFRRLAIEVAAQSVHVDFPAPAADNHRRDP